MIPLDLTVAASATMELFKKKIQGSGTTEIIISNVEIEKIMKIVNSLEESVLLIKGVGEAI